MLNRLTKKCTQMKIGQGLIALIGIWVVLNIIFLNNYSLTNLIAEKKRLKKMDKENNILVEENIRLLDEVEKLQHDDLYIESLARKNAMVKQGETIYFFTEED